MSAVYPLFCNGVALFSVSFKRKLQKNRLLNNLITMSASYDSVQSASFG